MFSYEFKQIDVLAQESQMHLEIFGSRSVACFHVWAHVPYLSVLEYAIHERRAICGVPFIAAFNFLNSQSRRSFFRGFWPTSIRLLRQGLFDGEGKG